MVRLALSEFQERLKVAQEMLKEAYPENAAVGQMCEAIEIAGQVVFHMSVPFQNIVEEKLDIQR
jgi:diadenosine tetraphosphate (Ap4A) HIT family hydrolase